MPPAAFGHRPRSLPPTSDFPWWAFSCGQGLQPQEARGRIPPMSPDPIGLHQSDGHLVPQADPHRQPLQVVAVVRVQIAIGGRTFSMSRAIFAPPPPPSWESKPIVNDRPLISRVLWGDKSHTGQRAPVLASTESSRKAGKPENHGTSCGCANYVNLLTK